ncbi:MAG: hypothetical protein H6559_27755 [Lewinellaceae bacterium]|nr:hypothetical protein [Lewinellaceae bacterium]
MKEHSGFYTSAVFWKDFREKALSVKKVRHLLNDNLSLDKYGSGIKSFSFVPIATRPNNTLHEEIIKYSSDKKEMNVALKLDFKAVSDSDESAFLQLLAHLFLRAIDEAPQHKVRDFDWPRFRQDVAELFQAEGWLQAA